MEEGITIPRLRDVYNQKAFLEILSTTSRSSTSLKFVQNLILWLLLLLAHRRLSWFAWWKGLVCDLLKCQTKLHNPQISLMLEGMEMHSTDLQVVNASCSICPMPSQSSTMTINYFDSWGYQNMVNMPAMVNALLSTRHSPIQSFTSTNKLQNSNAFCSMTVMEDRIQTLVIFVQALPSVQLLLLELGGQLHV